MSKVSWIYMIHEQRKNEFDRIESRFSGAGSAGGRTFRKKSASAFLSFIFSIIHRILEISLSLFFIIIFTFPLAFYKLLSKIITGKKVFERAEVYGAGGNPLKVLFFRSERYYIRNATLFLYVLSGKLRLVGIGVEKFGSRQDAPENAYLMRDKPGIFSLWFIRESGKIGHEGKTGTEWEYVFRRRLVGDIVLMLKSIPAALMRTENSAFHPEISLFGIKFRNMRMSEALELIENSIRKKERKKIYFVNPDCFNKTFSDDAYSSVLKNGDVVFPDGSGLNLACKIIKKPLLENVNGTDMFPFLCRLSAEKKYSIYLLGAKPGIADAVKKNSEASYPGIVIAGARDGYFDMQKDSKSVIAEINRLDPDILFVAFGAPVQEKWISSNFGQIKARVCIGVGGLFDFYSGRIPRAPKWMREFGLEWIFRLMQEPVRMWKRYIIGNPLFVLRVIQWKAFMEDSDENRR